MPTLQESDDCSATFKDYPTESHFLSNQSLLDRIPATVLVMLAIVSIQLGAAIATGLFPELGAGGTVAARISFSAILLLSLTGRRLQQLPAIFVQHWRLLLPFGVCMAVMNLFFYESIARIPLGAAVAIEFIGPLSVAAFNSRRLQQLLWVAVAALGVFLLSPFAGTDLDWVGVLFALGAGAGWALFILLSGRISSSIRGNDGLALAMLVAAIVLLPLFVPVAPVLAQQPMLLLMALAVAVLSTSLPFTLEFEALKRLPPRVYGVLVSLEPAIAALVGALLLSERIGLIGVIAVSCVVSAALGISYSEYSGKDSES